MTDFMSSLLASMATKFNEATENIKVDITEDKTMKWRGLLNNKFAAGPRKDRIGKRTRKVINGNQLPASSMATAAASSADLMLSQSTPGTGDKTTTVSTDKNETSNCAADKTRRVLRRKKLENNQKQIMPPKRRRRRTAMIDNKTKEEPPKIIHRRTGRPKKQIITTTTTTETDVANKDKWKSIESAIEAVVRGGEIVEEEKPLKLRRSERTQGQQSTIEQETESISKKSEGKIDAADIPKSITENEGKDKETIIEIPKTEDFPLKSSPNDENPSEMNKNAPEKETKDDQKDSDKFAEKMSESDAQNIKIMPKPMTEERSIETDPIESELKIDTPAVPTPKKRGRKPGTKLKPKISQMSTIKKSLRLSKDGISDSVLASAMARREKINEQISPPQRLSRRIKPTAKILANDELRYGFELQNNARLSISSGGEHLEKTPEKSPQSFNPNEEHKPDKSTLNTSPPSPVTNESIIIKLDENSPENSIQFRTPPPPSQPPSTAAPQRRPCPDPVDFLNEIKLAKINLHRSPEDNKKLNFKQKRRLFKLKEKHFNKLGLQKTTKSCNDSSMESSESDDVEEFVPNKKINVGRPSVTLRIRNQRESQTQESAVPLPAKKDKINPIQKSATEHKSPNFEKSLLLSVRRKRNIKSSSDQSNTLSATIVKKEILPTICLCNKLSKYYTQKAPETSFCHAIDEIETKQVGCTNEIADDLINLLRPSVRVSYMILCGEHRKRLISHNCCAGCGIFCTQGRFILCSQNHIFHRDCAAKFILNSPFNPQNPKFSYPTLVLKCPHCGLDAPEHESFIGMMCQRAPVFVPNQRDNLKTARMTIDLQNIKEITKNEQFFWELEKLIPDSVLALVAKAQNNFPFSRHDKYTTKDVFYAIHKNDVDRVAEIIASGFDITLPLTEYHNGTCLHLVSNSGNINMAYLILSRSPSIDFLNVVDKQLRSAAMCAVVGNRNDILKLLVQCGADVTLKGSDGMTALHLAAKTGNLTAAMILLENYKKLSTARKFDDFLNAVDDGGWTAVVWAAEIGYSDLVTYFVQCGSDIGIRDSESNTVLHWAIMSDNMETIVPLLREDCDYNAQNVNGDTPLHIACRNSNTQLCLMLLARGASLNIKNGSGDQPYDCIPNENSACARAIQFNAMLRTHARRSESRIICQDISNGREYYPIKVVRKSKREFEDDSSEIDECPLPDFKYITKTILLQNTIQIDQRISQMRICSCSDNCTQQSCQCSEISIQNWYNADGRLNGNFNYRDPAMIFECNDVCGCNKLLCKNRIVQNGTKCSMQITECNEKIKGWGVIGLTKIHKGTFVAEYTGEILTDVEADRRTDDSYFFDLGASKHCIDANYYGNISRFFNHSCDPNIVPIRVYFEHQDLRFPKIAFFASRDIEAGEELTFDYGEKFWLIKYKSFTCRCGEPNCRYSTDAIQKTLAEHNQRLSRPSN